MTPPGVGNMQIRLGMNPAALLGMGVVSQPVRSDPLAPARNQPAASAFIGASSPTDREEQPFWSACRFKGAWAAENRATSFLRRSFRLGRLHGISAGADPEDEDGARYARHKNESHAGDNKRV